VVVRVHGRARAERRAERLVGDVRNHLRASALSTGRASAAHSTSATRVPRSLWRDARHERKSVSALRRTPARLQLRTPFMLLLVPLRRHSMRTELRVSACCVRSKARGHEHDASQTRLACPFGRRR
jgi:hypothetical protein